MTKQELLIKLKEVLLSNQDKEIAHAYADDLLLEYIDSEEITTLFNDAGFWYA